MKSSIFFLFHLLCSTFIFAQQDYTIIRHPALNPDGSALAFSYQGDIWTVPSSGGKAIRLTIHEAYESEPKWSPDGSRILFTSERNGNGDIYTIKADGSDLKRITHHSAGDGSGSWKGNNTIYFSTSRNFRQVEREGEFHMISANGGTPERAMDVLGSDLNIHRGGELHAFVRKGCRIEREAYRGPANRDIWLYNSKNKKYLEITSDDGQDVSPEWGKGNDLYFLSARTGRYNIYKTTISNNGSQASPFSAITNFTDEGIRHFDVAADGSSLVFMHGEKVQLHNISTGDTKTIDITVGEDYRFDPVKYESFNNDMSDYAISPDEKHIAFTANGDLFFKKNDKERERSINPLPHPSREMDVEWLNDNTAIFLSDRGGTYDIYSIQSADEKEKSIFASFKWKINPMHTSSKEVIDFQLSPDKDKIAILEEPGTLIVADVDSTGMLSNNTTLLSGWASPSGLQWSPDGNWLAYALEDLNFNEEIYIHKADGSLGPVNVSMHPRGDSNPVWSRDGSKLGFISIRNNGDADVWFAWLKKENYEKTQDDWEEMDDDQDDKKKNGKEDKKKEDKMVMEIDLEDIHERLVQVTSMAGNEGDLAIDGEGELFLFSTNNGGRQGSGGKSEYKKVKWNGEDLEILMSNGQVSQVQLDKSGKALFYNSRGKLAMVDIKSGKSTALPHQAKMEVPNAEYRKQVFDEAWRTINDRFYDPNFHGQDWKALRTKYEPRALAASTSQDFYMLFNEMLGQVNASHMGLRGSGPEETQRERTGLLGLELRNHRDGVEITAIVPDSPADREESKLRIGEVITAVNNERVVAGVNFYSLLNDKANERVLLEVKSTDNTTREVIIRPASSLSTEKYEAWVEMQKALTDQYSNGRLGYIHIRGMNWPSFERFERELMASGYGKEGIVIDVRFNGGGWTTDMVMAVLNVRQHSYTIPRGATDDLNANHQKYKENYPYGERLPLSALTMPSVALCNETSYSNAEIFSHAFKTLGHGKLVGKATFGAVISTGGRGLMDGSFVRVPFRAWYVKATGENMEHGPAVPDYIVENEPEAKANNADQQLKKAVEVLLNEIDN
jgi:C-terminal processing protease CtpA/Prc/Tol biopolymer transport system component